MAEVTVSQLAGVVGTPVERLLQQMQQAGLAHTKAEQLVSDDDKQKLLAFLKSSHGESTAEPRKITLKRKTISTLKSGAGPAKKTVSVEVRKRRTYVKRDSDDLSPQELEAAQDEENELEIGVSELPELAPEPVVAEAEVEVIVEEAEPAPVVRDEYEEVVEERKSSTLAFDPEVVRQQAAAKRKQREADDKARALAAVAAKRAQEELEKQQAARKEEKPLKVKPRATGTDTEEDATQRRKAVKDKPTGNKGRGKDRGHNLHVDRLLDDEEQGSGGRRRPRTLKLPEDARRHAFSQPTEKIMHEVALPEFITVAELAQKMSVKSSVVIKELIKLGIMATINQSIDQETAQLVVEELGHKAKLVSADELEVQLDEIIGRQQGTPVPRAPVVTVMGHVDHGKTSLLDYIRKTRVASGEAGGITQHIGAYHVDTDKGMISFLDTPGHAAFTAMRARGAKSTDIVVLVVAADDGVMPQTEEAVQHARAAKVPLVVAVNKIDKPGADPERVRSELASRDVLPEDWGGEVQFINVSAHTGQGINELLDAILLQAEVLELKAPLDVPAQGVVIESRLDKGLGSVSSVMVQAGVLRQGDIVLAGQYYGRVRALHDENGKPVMEAGPSIPVEILGLDGTPDAGDPFFVLESEKRARELSLYRQTKERENKLRRQQAGKLENVFANMGAEAVKSLNIVLKADVRGSLEAIQSALRDIGNEEVQVNIVASGVGGISESDVNLARTASAVIFGFNVRAESSARKLVEDEGIELRYYSVIYNMLDDVKSALSGMLNPERREEILGVAEVRDVFKSPKFGQVAGCMVVEGTVFRNKRIRVLRDNVVIFEGELESLRRFKDDVGEVRSGFECGIGVKNYNDVRAGDKIEVYEVKQVARSL